MRDLALAKSGYLFARSGQLLLQKEHGEEPQTVLTDALFAMKFEARSKRFMIEIAGIQPTKLDQNLNKIKQKGQKLQFPL